MVNDPQYHYDYIIIGNGLSGSQLALAFTRDAFFKNKRIGVIEKDHKTVNDKTWCFWEKGKGQWDDIVERSWSKTRFKSLTKDLLLHLDPYQYKMIRSLDFYEYCRDILSQNPNISFITDEILEVNSDQPIIRAIANDQEYSCTHLFDSRIPDDFFTDNKAISLIQHFKGYVIETEKDYFNPDEFVMMDYRLRYNETTSFIYILPIKTNKALVEFTFFTAGLVEEKIYDEYLNRYISDYLNISEFKIVEIEKGKIPMTDFNFEKYNTSNITKIGTAGGWVKGSTGYSFKHTEKKVKIIIDNLKNSKTPSSGLFNKRFKFYDSIFLSVLYENNEQGMNIFEKFYSKNNAENYLAFLDEDTNLFQELKILASLYSPLFIKSFRKYLFKM